jgi:hypothetical protein
MLNVQLKVYESRNGLKKASRRLNKKWEVDASGNMVREQSDGTFNVPTELDYHGIQLKNSQWRWEKVP